MMICKGNVSCVLTRLLPGHVLRLVLSMRYLVDGQVNDGEQTLGAQLDDLDQKLDKVIQNLKSFGRGLNELKGLAQCCIWNTITVRVE